jgi:predicted GNAT family acetyltransferase
MQIIKHNDIKSFLIANEVLLLKNESFHNLILGLAYNIRDQKLELTDPIYYSIKNGDEVIACALRSNSDRPLIVTKMPNEAIDLLIQNLINNQIELASVVGEENSSIYFKDQWVKIKNLNFKINIHLGVFECTKVKMPENILGELIQADSEHRNILHTYIKGFNQDCFPNQPMSDEDVEKLIIRNLNNKSIFLLKNKSDELVSMAANFRSTLNGGTISLVYTPPEYRGFGYASSAVALLSQKIIHQGKKFANLFTDLSNPTSNSIYQKIGFVKIGQNIHFDFIENDHS